MQLKWLEISRQKRRRSNRIVILMSLFFLLIISWACSAKQEPQQQKAEESYPWKLICIGDGITIGNGLDGNLAYPALLEKMLRESTMPRAKVVNAGVKGETIAGINQRIEWMLQQRFSAILLALNEQDFIDKNEEVWKQCLQKIKFTNPDALILIGSASGQKTFSDIKAFFKPFYEHYNIEVIDLQLDTPERKNIWWQDDHQYLTQEGQLELASRIFNRMKN